MDQHTDTLIELNAKLERLINGIDTLHVTQERMCDDISKIKEAVYNPDSGLYARLRALEMWKETQSRVQWLVTSGVIMLIVKMFWDVMMTGGAGQERKNGLLFFVQKDSRASHLR